MIQIGIFQEESNDLMIKHACSGFSRTSPGLHPFVAPSSISRCKPFGPTKKGANGLSLGQPEGRGPMYDVARSVGVAQVQSEHLISTSLQHAAPGRDVDPVYDRTGRFFGAFDRRRWNSN